MENENILIMKDLDVRLFTDRGELPVIDRLSLTLKAGETLGIVGESGCGKSMLASAIMGLVAHPGKVTGGSIQFEGQELVGMKKKDLRRIRGTGISMIFQEPMTSLKETGTSVIFISHDMGVISQMADRVAVMYAGQLVEYAEGEKIFTEPEHPYTQGLQAAIPRLDEEKDTLLSIPGNVPMLYDLPKGCIFSPRCAHATEQCRNERPELVENSGHLVRCFLHEDNKKHTESQSKGGAQA